jgi:hypothetical protein
MRLFALACLFFLYPLTGAAQSEELKVPYQIFAGYSRLSNSINGVPSAQRPLNGWEVSTVAPDWRHIRFKIDVSGFSGTNLNAQQREVFILAGGQYEHSIRRERLFMHALVGNVALDDHWGANGALGGRAAFATVIGGGADTPIHRHFALRLQGDWMHTNPALFQSAAYKLPYRIPGLPQNFGRITAGLVWMPKLVRIEHPIAPAYRESPEQEVSFIEETSIGHYHILAGSWWSNLYMAGVEYSRHSWGRFLGARRDYVADILPVVFLRQPAKTDSWGDPLGTGLNTVSGLGISPIGTRLVWFESKPVRPFFIAKGGMIGFTQKATARSAAYENFTLQEGIGLQARVSRNWDFRASFVNFHFSDGFVVPSNPGLDSMMLQGGLTYHLNRR